MIWEGSHGSVCFYFENKLVASLPLTEENCLDRYWKQVGGLIAEGLREGNSLKYQKNLFWKGVHHALKKMNRIMNEVDNKYIAITLLALIRLKQIDPDGLTEGMLECPIYRPRNRRRRRPKKRHLGPSVAHINLPTF
jgi:hypothetical protein